MSDDFVTRLGLQLQEAAERDMRRSAPSRALRGQRWLSPALAGAIALAVVVAAVAAATLWLRGDATPLPAQPRVVATLHVTDNPVQIVDAFGSIWIADHVAGRILRLDPATGAVQATIQVRTGNWLWITPVRDQLWASVDELPLIQRIDPETNRVVARTPVRTPDGRPFRVGNVWAAGDNVWAVSGIGAAAPRPRQRPRASCVADAPRAVRWFELGDDTLWALGLGDTLHRLDPRTGRAPGQHPVRAARHGEDRGDRGRPLRDARSGARPAGPGDGRGDLDAHVRGAVERDHAVAGRRLGARHDRRAGRPARLVRRGDGARAQHDAARDDRAVVAGRARRPGLDEHAGRGDGRRGSGHAVARPEVAERHRRGGVHRRAEGGSRSTSRSGARARSRAGRRRTARRPSACAARRAGRRPPCRRSRRPRSGGRGRSRPASSRGPPRGAGAGTRAAAASRRPPRRTTRSPRRATAPAPGRPRSARTTTRARARG